MKKFIIIYFLLLISTVVSAQVKNAVTIGILADKSLDSGSTLSVQLKKEIEALLGQNKKVVFSEALANNYNIEIAKANYQTLLNNKTDIILAFGVVNSVMLKAEKSYGKPVIVFGSINTDLIQLPENLKTSGINNLTYLITPSSYINDLETFQSIFEYKKVGIIVDEFLIKMVPVKEYFDVHFSKLETSYELILLKEDGSINSLLNDVDAVYLAGGFHLNDSDFKALVSTINEKKLPSFSGFRKDDVVRGILAGNQSETNINHFFRRIALNIESILTGINPSELPMYIEYKNELTLNYNTADLIDFPLRYSLLASANLIGEEATIKSESTFSIKDIMDAVVGKNLSLKAERKSVDLKEQDLKTAKSNYLPSLDANVNGVYLDPEIAKVSNGQNPELTTNGSLTLEQVLYSPSASGNVGIQKELNKAQVEVYNTAELDALLNASIAYFNTLILKTNAKIQNQNLQVTKKNLQIAKNLYEEGSSGKSDLLRYKSQLAQNTQSLVEAASMLKQSYFTINQLINNPITEKIGIEDAELSKGLFKNYNYEEFKDLIDNPKLQPALVEFLVGEAKQNSPELKNIDYNIEATIKSKKMNSNSRFIPTVALQGQYNLEFSRAGEGVDIPVGFPVIPDNNYNVALNLSLPIFQRNQRRINIQTTKIQEEQLTFQRENIELNIDKNINSILLDIVNQIANIETSKIAEETAKENLELSQNAYEQGAMLIIQLIDAQTNYLQAQLSSATANYNYLIISMQLERSIGYFFLMNSEEDNQEFIQRATQFINNKN